MNQNVMIVDLSSGTYTKEDIARLLASGDDSSHSQLHVLSTGLAYISKDTDWNDEGVSLRFETWIAGKRWVGPIAAENDAWVTKVFNALREHWPNPERPYVDVF